MKKCFFLFALVCLAVSGGGCSKDDAPEDNGTVKVSDPKELNQELYADQGPKAVAFTAEGDWTASVTADSKAAVSDWIDVDPKSGNAGTATIRMTLQPNLSGADRSATIVIRCQGSSLSISVTQTSKTQSGEVPGIFYCGDDGKWSAQLPSQTETLSVESRGGSFPLTVKDLASIAKLPLKSVNLGNIRYENAVFPDVFAGSDLQNVVLPNNISELGSRAFAGCSRLLSVEFPSVLEIVGDGAFDGCGSLSGIALPQALKTIGKQAFAESALENIEFPQGLITIGENAFSRSALRTVVFLSAETALSVGDGAFSFCEQLQNVSLSPSVSRIGTSAFEGCISLLDVELPSGLVAVGDKAFKGCTALTKITTGDKLEELGEWMFADCPALGEVKLGGGLRIIGYAAFENCKALETIDLPTSLISIKDNAFNNCNLKSIVFPQNLEELGSALGNCENLANVTFETDKLSVISHGLFQGNKALMRVELPESITQIEDMAFNNCQKLDWVSLGSRVKSIGEQAFAGCSYLSAVICHAAIPPVWKGEIVFASAGSLFPDAKGCWVPAASVEAYKTDASWQILESKQHFSFLAISE